MKIKNLSHAAMKATLQKIASSKKLETRWLNTLSLLEYIGARKISKTVCLGHPSLEIMQHYADETRHAYIFRKLSANLAGGKTAGYLCPDEATSYFQMLDTFVAEWLSEITGKDDPYQNYLFVTCMIERRAMKMYPLYMASTKNSGVKNELQEIIKEEACHRDIIELKVKEILKKNKIQNMNACLKVEEDLFKLFATAVEREIKLH